MAVVEVAQDGHVRTITLNRPEKKNAISDELGWTDIGAAVEGARDDDVWVVALIHSVIPVGHSPEPRIRGRKQVPQ